MIFSHQGAVRVEQPFQMTVSRGCIGYYRSYDLTGIMGRLEEIDDNDRDEGNDSIDFRPGGLEEIAQGRGRCPQCAVLVRCHYFVPIQHPIFKLDALEQ